MNRLKLFKTQSMYAIVKISGKQWKVEPQNRISVDKLPTKKD